MPAIKHDDVLLRLIKDVNDIRANLRRVVANLPLYDIANENTPAQITANQNNYVPGNYDVLRISSSKTIAITGIANGVKGRSLRLANVGTHVITFKNQSSLSVAKNRFNFPQQTISISPQDSITLYYDSTDQRWILLSINPASTLSADPIFWTARYPSLSQFTDICWSDELGIFVAVRSATTGVYSPDGVVWSEMTIGAAVNGVCWSSTLGIFVAVGNNIVRTSPDGIVWSAATAAAANNWTAVIWSETVGLFVAVSSSGTGNRVMTSANGINWNIGVSAEDRAWRDVIWVDDLGMFIAVNDDIAANGIMTSPNGIAWTARADGNGNGLAWSSSLNLAISAGRLGLLHKSIDGTAWSSVTPPSGWTTTAQASVEWSESLGIFVVVGDNADSIWSADGDTWYRFNFTPTSANWIKIAFSEILGMFCAVSSSSANTKIMTGQ